MAISTKANAEIPTAKPFIEEAAIKPVVTKLTAEDLRSLMPAPVQAAPIKAKAPAKDLFSKASKGRADKSRAPLSSRKLPERGPKVASHAASKPHMPRAVSVHAPRAMKRAKLKVDDFAPDQKLALLGSIDIAKLPRTLSMVAVKRIYGELQNHLEPSQIADKDLGTAREFAHYDAMLTLIDHIAEVKQAALQRTDDAPKLRPSLQRTDDDPKLRPSPEEIGGLRNRVHERIQLSLRKTYISAISFTPELLVKELPKKAPSKEDKARYIETEKRLNFLRSYLTQHQSPKVFIAHPHNTSYKEQLEALDTILVKMQVLRDPSSLKDFA